MMNGIEVFFTVLIAWVFFLFMYKELAEVWGRMIVGIAALYVYMPLIIETHNEGAAMLFNALILSWIFLPARTHFMAMCNDLSEGITRKIKNRKKVKHAHRQ